MTIIAHEDAKRMAAQLGSHLHLELGRRSGKTSGIILGLISDLVTCKCKSITFSYGLMDRYNLGLFKTITEKLGLVGFKYTKHQICIEIKYVYKGLQDPDNEEYWKTLGEALAENMSSSKRVKELEAFCIDHGLCPKCMTVKRATNEESTCKCDKDRKTNESS